MYKVYWTGAQRQPCSEDFTDLGQALKHAQQMRECLMSFVTMVSEDPNVVGKPGVDSVVDGLLPDGTAYEWKMRR